MPSGTVDCVKADTEAFLVAVRAELARARAKFPSAEISAVALMEEVGELARALLEESRERVTEEAVQVAAMACRVAYDWDPSVEKYRLMRGLQGFPSAQPAAAATSGEQGRGGSPAAVVALRPRDPRAGSMSHGGTPQNAL